MSLRTSFPASLFAAALIGAAAPAVPAQSSMARGVIDGVVTDTGLVSLGDATVSILGSSLRVVTSANGRFRIVGLSAGQYILVVHRLGYVPSSTTVQIAARDTLRMSFALARIATALDTVVVAAKGYTMRMTEFEDRRRAGFGHFMTQADIEKRNVAFVADLIRPILSVWIAEKGLAAIAVNMRGGCAFQVVLDGVPLPRPTDLNSLPPPSDLAGIEIYSGPATIPLQYKRAGSGCGVILIWTKDGT